MHHGPAPGQQLSPRCPAEQPCQDPEPCPGLGTSCMPLQYLLSSTPGHPRMDHLLPVANIGQAVYLQAARLARGACRQEGISCLGSRLHPGTTKALSLQSHPFPLLEIAQGFGCSWHTHVKSLGHSTACKGAPSPLKTQILLFPMCPERKKKRRLRKTLLSQEIILEEGQQFL